MVQSNKVPYSSHQVISVCMLYRSRGVQGVIADYARPFVIGQAAAKAARAGAYVITGLLLAGESSPGATKLPE